jgi:hypothetical protein
MNNAQKLQAVFDAGRAADLPVTLHLDKVTIAVSYNVQINFDPLDTANFADLIKQRLGMSVTHSAKNFSYRTNGTVRVEYQGAQLVHEYDNEAPWKAGCEAVVRMAALLWKAKQSRGEPCYG